MKKVLDIPYVSQGDLFQNKEGLSRACGMACVKMFIEFAHGESAALIDLLAEGQTIIGGYIAGTGWTHFGLVATLRNHNVGAYAEEFRSVKVKTATKEFAVSPYEKEHIERGILKIVREIEEERPVIVSGIKNWKEKDKPHLMLVTGFERDGEKIQGLHYHDPYDKEGGGENRFVDIDTFRKNWRKLAIFLSQ